MMLPRHVPMMLAGDGFRATHPGAHGAPSEVAYTGLKVRVLSAPKARVYTPRTREVAISIRGPDESEVVLSPRFAAVLRLVFPDIGHFAAPHTGSPDATQTITAAQADQLAAFVRTHRDAAVLVVHCTAGVSRSRSAAAAICAALTLPYSFCVLNEEVYDAVSNAFARAHARSADEWAGDPT